MIKVRFPTLLYLMVVKQLTLKHKIGLLLTEITEITYVLSTKVRNFINYTRQSTGLTTKN